MKKRYQIRKNRFLNIVGSEISCTAIMDWCDITKIEGLFPNKSSLTGRTRLREELTSRFQELLRQELTASRKQLK
jgi:hypothetical protein